MYVNMNNVTFWCVLVLPCAWEQVCADNRVCEMLMSGARIVIDEEPVQVSSHGFGAAQPILKRKWGWAKLLLVLWLCLEPGVMTEEG